MTDIELRSEIAKKHMEYVMEGHKALPELDLLKESREINIEQLKKHFGSK